MEKLPPQIRRVVIAEINSRNAELLENTKKIDAQNRVLVSKVHNLQVEVQTLTTLFSKLLLTLSDCLVEPSSQTEAQAVVRDFLNHIIPKT
jgi:hypothetical protein